MKRSFRQLSHGGVRRWRLLPAVAVLVLFCAGQRAAHAFGDDEGFGGGAGGTAAWEIGLQLGIERPLKISLPGTSFDQKGVVDPNVGEDFTRGGHIRLALAYVVSSPIAVYAALGYSQSLTEKSGAHYASYFMTRTPDSYNRFSAVLGVKISFLRFGDVGGTGDGADLSAGWNPYVRLGAGAAYVTVQYDGWNSYSGGGSEGSTRFHELKPYYEALLGMEYRTASLTPSLELGLQVGGYAAAVASFGLSFAF